MADVFQGRGVVVSTHGLHEPQHVYVANDAPCGICRWWCW